eukprot:c19845_g1_i2.p1 GENE.c19845_g1_i2~~c19845_g1_i2.p1  ORF type:complete len:676 (-),score=117.69 c19845_g1_i2:318-2345(-)
MLIGGLFSRMDLTSTALFRFVHGTHWSDRAELLSDSVNTTANQLQTQAESLAQLSRSSGVSKNQHLTVLAFAAGLYLETCLQPSARNLLTASLADMCRQTILDLMRHGRDTTAAFDVRPDSSLLTVLRAALHFKGLSPNDSSHAPVFYFSSRVAQHVRDHHNDQFEVLCVRLRLGLENFRVVPNNAAVPSPKASCHTIDLTALERMIREDLGSARTPTCLVLQAGSAPLQHCDNITTGLKICDKYGMWCHVQGPSTRLLVHADRSAIHPAVRDILRAHSVAIDTRTLLQPRDAAAPMCILFSGQFPSQLPVAPAPLSLLAATILRLRRPGLFASVQRAVAVAIDETAHVVNDVAELPTLDQPFLDASAPHVTCFQFCPLSDKNFPKETLISVSNRRLEAYFEKRIDVVPSGFFLLSHRTKGPHWCVFDPLRLVNTDLSSDFTVLFSGACSETNPGTRLQALSAFVQQVAWDLDHVNAVVSASHRFETQAKNQGFTPVRVPDFFGLGAVRCTPNYATRMSDDESEQQSEIERFNVEMAERLVAIDASVFQKLEVNHQVVIGVGPFDDPDDNGLLDVLAVLDDTKRSLESQRIITALGTNMRQIIEQAEEQLARAKASQEESALRSIPLVGSLVNFFAPPAKAKSLPGCKWEIPPEVLNQERTQPGSRSTNPRSHQF